MGGRAESRFEVRSGNGMRVDLEGELKYPLAFACRLVPQTVGIGRRGRGSVAVEARPRNRPICDTGGEVGGGGEGSTSRVVLEHEVGLQGRLRLELGRLLPGLHQELVGGLESALADGEDGDLGRGCIEDGQSHVFDGNGAGKCRRFDAARFGNEAAHRRRRDGAALVRSALPNVAVPVDVGPCHLFREVDRAFDEVANRHLYVKSVCAHASSPWLQCERHAWRLGGLRGLCRSCRVEDETWAHLELRRGGKPTQSPSLTFEADSFALQPYMLHVALKVSPGLRVPANQWLAIGSMASGNPTFNSGTQPPRHVTS
eukprot:scaffold16720_cov75-Phaeocystis_antarctica.AAC.3